MAIQTTPLATLKLTVKTYIQAALDDANIRLQAKLDAAPDIAACYVILHAVQKVTQEY